MRSLSTWLFVFLVTPLACHSNVLSAEADEGTSAPTIQADSQFEELARLEDVGKAIFAMDAVLLMKVAEGFSAAEEKLGRKHKSGLTAETLFKKALQLAVVTGGDVDRVAKSATATGDKDLARMAKIIRLTSPESRSIASSVVMDVETQSVDAVLYVRLVVDQVEFAKLTGDDRILDRLDADVAAATFLEERQRQALKSAVKKAREFVRDDSTNELLRALAGTARDGENRPSIVEIAAAQADLTDAHSTMITAVSQAQLTAQQVRMMAEMVKSQQMDNKKKNAHLYYELKKMYNANRRKRTTTPDERDRYAKSRAPQRMQTKDARWPALFDSAPMRPAKDKLQSLFAERSPKNSGANSDNHVKIRAVVGKIQGVLVGRIRELPPMEYIAIKRFLRQVSYEASLPMDASTSPDALLALSGDKAATAAPTELLAQLTRRLSAPTRSAEPAQVVPIMSTEPEAYALYQAFVDSVKSASAFKDAKALDGLKSAVEHAPLLTKTQKAYILKCADSGAEEKLDNIIEDPISEVADSLARIGGIEPSLSGHPGSRGFEPDTRYAAFTALAHLFDRVL